VITGLLLLARRDAFLTWATFQLAAPPDASETAIPFLPAFVTRSPEQQLALLLQALLHPPLMGWLHGLLLTGGPLVGLEILVGLLLAGLRRHHEWRAARMLLRIRALPDSVDPARMHELLRSLHSQIAVGPLTTLLGRAPWLALTLHGQPGEPLELAVFLAAPDRRRLAALCASVQAAIEGHVPHALVEPVDDPLTASLPPTSLLAWQSFAMQGPHSLPLRALADVEGDLFAPLASALRPRDVVATELQLILRAERSWALTSGWRADGRRRLLRLQQRDDPALSPDVRRLEARLDAPAFAVRMQVIVVATGTTAQSCAQAALQQVRQALDGFARRTGPWRQAIGPDGQGQTRADARPRRLRTLLARHPAPPALPRLILPLPAAHPPLLLTVDELSGLWHMPTADLQGIVQCLHCRHLRPPAAAFLPPYSPLLPASGARIALGLAHEPQQRRTRIGVTLADLRYVLHLTAGMGAGKSRVLANLCQQLRPAGFCLIDGKGDDAGSLVNTVLDLLPRSDEARVVLLDPRDARWPVGLNPLANLDLSQPGASDVVVANVFALFARIDPQTWGAAQGMRDFLDKALRLVLSSEAQPTLAHVKQALLDAEYRAVLLQHCHNRDVSEYWEQVFPRIGEQQRSSRDALLRRFDKLLSADLLRLMLTRPDPELNLAQAIDNRAIVLIPIPNVALGDLAGAYAMLVFQQFLRAAFARPGDDQSRTDYPLLIDELQVLVAEAANEDIETALSRLRSFAIPLVLAHQARAQLGPVIDLVDINAENRIILKTREPDASAYARQYGHTGLTAGDIIGQDPQQHQYAVLRCAGTPAGPFSMAPLPWPTPVVDQLPAYDEPPLPEVPAFATAEHGAMLMQMEPFNAAEQGAMLMQIETLVRQLAYEAVDADELNQRAEQFSRMPEEEFATLLQCWEQVRRAHLQHLADHPGCVPDRRERILWRSRLQYGMPYVLAEAIYRRARPEVREPAAPPPPRRGASSAHYGAAAPAPAPPPEPPAFAQADQPARPPQPQRPLYRAEDDDA
jgi:hypothetical protein